MLNNFPSTMAERVTSFCLILPTIQRGQVSGLAGKLLIIELDYTLIFSFMEKRELLVQRWEET